MNASPGDPLAQMFFQLTAEDTQNRRESILMVFGVYQFLIRQNLATREEVYEFLSSEAAGMDNTAQKAKTKGTLEVLASLFRDENPPDLRSRLELIHGGRADETKDFRED